MPLFTNLVLIFRTKNFVAGIGFLVVGTLALQPCYSQLVAFPGAEGSGRFASGGRGSSTVPTTVYEVTNLNDDNNPGSLRYALSQTAAYRTVVFRVSGTIHLNSQLNIRANTTVAGQTAPGDGICIADYPVAINGDNVIVRYMRFRMGDKNQNLGMVDGSGSGDAFSNLGNKNIIIDHCTSSWSSDEALTIYRGDSITVQWSFITEPLNYSYHFETGDTDWEEHGYGGIWGGRHATFHHNLIAHVKGRAPRFDGSRNLSPFTAGQENVDFRNNVLYNWNSYNVNGGEGGNYNIVGNYYKYGPSTSTGNSSGVPVRHMVINPGKQTSAPILPYGKYFLQGNYVDGSSTITQNNWLGAAMSGGTQADTTLAKATTAFDLGPMTTHSAMLAYDLVLQYGGASFSRDTLDARIANDVMDRTGRLIDVQGGYPHGTPYPATVNAWPTLNSTTAPVDTDHDGMPDTYESANGLNPNDPVDRNGIAGNGYTNLENYINGIVTAATVATTGTLTSFTQNLPAVSSTQSYSVSGTDLTSDIVITPPANFEVSADGGLTWNGSATPLTITHTAGIVLPKTITVRLNAAIAGPYSGNITNASTGAGTINVPVSGIANLVTVPSGPTITLLHWPFTANDLDSVSVRAAGVLPSTPTLYRLYTSNGTTVPAIPAYSPQFGQALGATSNGDGSWGTGSGGPGSTLRRTYYEQFTITADNGYEVNVDSLYVTAAFNNTSSSTRLAVVYSKSNFIADSADVFTIPGGFANPATLPNQTGGPTTQFPLSVAGPGGVTLLPGQTLTFRFYFSCGSSSAGRYAMVKDVKLVGRTTDLASIKKVIQHWPFTTNADDSAFVRSAGVVASTPTLYRLYTSNGTTIPAIPAYSSQFGQALGATANGDGSWGTAAGGPGGTLRRTYYEQFTVTAKSGYSLRVDSIHTTAAFYNTSSSTRLAIVYSLSNFVSDSADVSTIPGGFANPITLANQTGGPTNKYELEVAGAAGVTLQPGQTLTFRLYFSCGSSTAGRYSMIKDVKVIGSTIPVVGPVSTIITTATLADFAQTLGTASPVQTYTVSGSGLTTGITITAPADYEVSDNGGTTWFTNASPLVLPHSGGNIAITTISVRLNAITAGNFTGNISHASTGATTMNVGVNGTALPASFITATSAFNAFSQVIGTPSVTQTYTVEATGLSQDLTITPPTDFELSGDGGATWHTSSSPLVLVPTLGAIPPTTLTVRLNASALGIHTGNITHTSAGAATINVALTGTTVPVPLITTVSTMSAFSHTVGTASAIQTYTVSGADLLGNLTITPPVHFEVSSDGGTTWRTNTTPLVLTASGSSVNATISVRMNASAAGNFSGNIVHSTSSALNVSVAVTGTAIPAPLITLAGTPSTFTQVLGAISPAQTYTVTGANLTGNISITPPADYEISSNGGTSWSTSALTLTQTGGTVAATTISVRLNSTSLGAHTGNIAHVSSGAVTKNLALTGVTVPKPVIIVTHSFATFSQTVGGTVAVQSYTVAGTNLTGNIIITPPAHFQVSANNGSSWQSTNLTLTRVNGAVAPTTILVRLNVPVTGMYSGVLKHTSSDADPVDVLLNGQNKVNVEYVIYPVPATRTIFLAHPVTAERAIITFYNSTGHKIATHSSQPNTIETMIDVNQLPQGLYFVEYRLGETKVLLKFIRS
jgi:hypothetical protein